MSERSPAPIWGVARRTNRTKIHAIDVPECDYVGSLDERRRHARAEAVGEVAATSTDGREPAIAVRVYGEGCLAVALGGEFDRPSLERLRNLIAVLPGLAPAELTLDLLHLHSCPSTLVRALARLRMQRLIDGARVELHNIPAPLATEFGEAPAEFFHVMDDAKANVFWCGNCRRDQV